MYGLLAIATQNLPLLQPFYQSLLGLEPSVTLEGSYIEFRLPHFRLGLYRSNNPEYLPRLGATSLTLQVSDLDAVLANPILSNIHISPLRVEFHGREVDFCDPDGNRIVLHEPSEDFWQLMKLSE